MGGSRKKILTTFLAQNSLFEGPLCPEPEILMTFFFLFFAQNSPFEGHLCPSAKILTVRGVRPDPHLFERWMWGISNMLRESNSPIPPVNHTLVRSDH